MKIVELFSKDSTNMAPMDWVEIGKCIKANSGDVDAVIILHGTDTMAWTSTALSYLLPVEEITKPILLTGSITTLEVDGDAERNMNDTFEFAKLLIAAKRYGTYLVFNGKLHFGARVSKAVSDSEDAFQSIDCPPAGVHDASGYRLTEHTGRTNSVRPWKWVPAIEQRIAMFPIFPGVLASFLNALIATNPKAIVIEGLGLGGVPFEGENLLPSIVKAVKSKICVVIRSTSLFGGADLSRYEVGARALKAGVLSAGLMTREALITKLMFLLPVVSGRDLVRELGTDFSGETRSTP
jgi:L-asparaginase